MDDLKILVDTREQENRHIVKTFEINKIECIQTKLDFGDYSFISNGVDYRKKCVIERKRLEELPNNLGKKRKQFEKELWSAKFNNCYLSVMIERGEYLDICKHNYRSKMTPKSFIASLDTFKFRYGIDYIFINENASATYIYNTFTYFLKEYLNKINEINTLDALNKDLKENMKYQN